jgi:Protein of unknown function (DUF4236)
MGFRFHRSFKVMPGVRLNLSKSGPSVSIGGKGFHENFGPRGRRTTLSLPGTGISYVTTTTHHRRAPPNGYAVAFRQKGTSEDFYYFGADQEVHMTPDQCAPLNRAAATVVKERLEGMDPPAECRIVKLDMRARQQAEDTKNGLAALIGLVIGLAVFLAIVLAANA